MTIKCLTNGLIPINLSVQLTQLKANSRAIGSFNLEAANDFFQEEEYESAILKYNIVIQRSDYYKAYYGRALCYYMLEENSLALKDFYNADVVSHNQNNANYFGLEVKPTTV